MLKELQVLLEPKELQVQQVLKELLAQLEPKELLVQLCLLYTSDAADEG